MAKLLIKNGRVWDGACFFASDVLVEGDRITKIEPDLPDGADYTYDAAGKIVSAGLVDTHVHLRGISSQTFGIQGEMSCFPFGVTAAADAGGVQGDRALLDSFQLKSAVFVPIDIKYNHADFTNADRMLPAYGSCAAGLKLYFSSGAGASDITPLREACAYAHTQGLPLMVHCSGQPVPMAYLLDELSAGDILSHPFHGGEHSAARDSFKSLRQAQDRGIVLDAAFAGHIHTDFGVLRQAVRQGVLPDTISTDITVRSAYTRGGRYGLTLCMSMARAAGMQEEDILRAVTSTPARILGKEGLWGTLAVGGRADIAVLEYSDEPFSLTDAAGNHLESKTGYRCVLTVADGQVVYRH